MSKQFVSVWQRPAEACCRGGHDVPHGLVGFHQGCVDRIAVVVLVTVRPRHNQERKVGISGLRPGEHRALAGPPRERAERDGHRLEMGAPLGGEPRQQQVEHRGSRRLNGGGYFHAAGLPGNSSGFHSRSSKR
jgi:hypothetical protein